MSKVVQLALLLGSLMVVESLRCEKHPEGVIGEPSDPHDFFSIEISANPTEYTPGEKYTITLRAHGDHRIKEFLLLVEHDTSKIPINEFNSFQVGTFHLQNILTKFSDKCPNAVANANVIPKTEIQVDWRAPDSGNGCVAFKAIVIESREQWYMDAEALTKRFCEEERSNGDNQPSVLTHCCACDEAKYEVTFEGLWSRNTHPKDFPSDKWRTRFSDVIGASHTTDYSFWSYGEYASEGMREVAENGSTRTLESELKAKSDHIRTIIKARGISYPNVTGKTFAVFRVDNRHHLMSLVSMIFPSPDWFVGVSSLELCLENCSWIESMTLILLPNDAGTDDGFTYEAPDQPTVPRGIIRKITSDSPNDDRSPFYDPQGTPIKPLARLYLSRQRLYEKTCSVSEEESGTGDYNCEVTEWSEWSPCSASCGRGVKYKQRKFRYDGNHHNCRVRLTERANCRGSERHCPQDSYQVEEDPRCQMTDWGEWSSCSVKCGVGTKTRSRRYKNRNAAKRCAAGRENPPPLEQNVECFGEEPGCEETGQVQLNCPNTLWSTWTPCSATCGKGIKARYRLSLDETDQRQFLMRQSRSQIGYDNEQRGEDNEDCDKEAPVEIVECIADDAPSCDDSYSFTEPATETTLPPEFESENSVYDVTSNEIITQEPWGPDVQNCKVSPWSEWSPCNITGSCGRGFKEKHREIIVPAMNGGKPCPTLFKVKKCRVKCRNGERERDRDPYAPMHPHEINENWGNAPTPTQQLSCIMSEWSAWSPCSQSCGPEAVQQRTRKIMRRVKGYGEPCSFRIDQRSCQLLACPLR